MKKYIIWVSLLLAAAGSVLLILEKLQITNFYSVKTNSSSSSSSTDKTSGEVPSAKPTNTVDYGPATEEDITSVPEKDPNLQPEVPANTNLYVSITNMRKSSDASSYLVKAAVAGTEFGTCSVTAEKSFKVISDQGTIGLSSNQISCLDLSLPVNLFTESGIWNITVQVTDQNGATASSSSTLEVIL